MMDNKRKKDVSGIYKVVHNVTGHHYYGGSKNAYLRMYQIQRRLLTKNFPSKRFAAVVMAHGNDFTYKLVKKVPVHQLNVEETKYLVKYGKSPLSINVNRIANGGAREIVRTTKDAHAHAEGLVGANLKRNIPVRSHVVTFVSPDGVSYTTESVKAFAKEHGLNQPSMNDLANDLMIHYKGWHLPSTDPSTIGGPLKNLDITIVAPDGFEYPHVKDLTRFCREHNAPYTQLYTQAAGQPMRRAHVDAADDYGRRWHVKGMMRVYRVVDIKTLRYWDNVTVLPRLAGTLGIPRAGLVRCGSGKQKKAANRYRVELIADITHDRETR